jgi:dTMP kinase
VVPSYPGAFITLEGPEGAGKTTQLKLLSKQLEMLKIKYTITRAPGGTSVGRQIRRLLLNPENPVTPMAELLLYEADLAENVEEIILPALKAGNLVICDRFIDSTMAYQGYARGINKEIIEKLNVISIQNIMPELTILFDIQSSEGLGRLHPGGHDRLEREAIEFHLKVREGYLELANLNPERWQIIDAGRPLSYVQTEFRRILVDRLSGKFDLSGLLEQSATP